MAIFPIQKSLLTHDFSSNSDYSIISWIELFDPNTGTWIQKGPSSTFFPKDWSRSEVLNQIRGAFNNQTLNRGNYWEGVSPSGVKIGGYLNNSGGINTAFPKY